MEEQNSSEPVAPPKPTFTDQMRLYTAPLIDPIVSFLAHYKVSPDVLTVVGMLAHFILAWLIAIGEFRWAGVAMILLAPLDALDGALARKLGRKQGGFGAYLDSTLDRLAEVILFGGFIYYYYSQGDLQMLAVAYVAVTGSLMVSYSRAKAESLGYENKVGIASRVERYLLMIVLLILNLPQIALIILAVATYFTLAQRMYSVWKQEYGQDESEA